MYRLFRLAEGTYSKREVFVGASTPGLNPCRHEPVRSVVPICDAPSVSLTPIDATGGSGTDPMPDDFGRAGSRAGCPRGGCPARLTCTFVACLSSGRTTLSHVCLTKVPNLRPPALRAFIAPDLSAGSCRHGGDGEPGWFIGEPPRGARRRSCPGVFGARRLGRRRKTSARCVRHRSLR